MHPNRAPVDKINAERLDELPGEEFQFQMRSWSADGLHPEAAKRYIDTLKKNCLSPETLKLKVGALVMFTKNSPTAEYVNGTSGVIEGFERGNPIIRTKAGRLVTAERDAWSINTDDGDPIASINQIPLRLAWAITVHKSQGMTLDAALMDLNRCFEYGQGYVGLSRVSSLDGLHLINWSIRALQVHPTQLW